MINIQQTPVLLVAALVCTGILAGCTTTRALDTEGEKSFDGLTPIKGATMNKVWVRPDFDLTGYQKVILVGAEIQYRPVKGRAGGSGTHFRSSDNEFPMTEEQKDRLERVLDEEFTKAFEKLTRYEIVEERGPDVLLVRGTLVDVVSRTPPDGPGRTDYYLDSVGQATFVVEFLDSQSDGVLIRAIDTRAAGTQGYTVRANTATNTAEVRRMASRWADMLVAALNELDTIDG